MQPTTPKTNSTADPYAGDDDPERGRDADSPTEIPASGWRDVLLRTWRQLGADQVGLVAAGVAFYAMLAVFPGMAALVAIYGLVSDPADVGGQLGQLAALPEEARVLLGRQLTEIAGDAGGSLGIAAVTGILGALWSANRGAGALVRAMNVAYDETEDRGFVHLSALSFVFTVGAVCVAIVALTLIVGVPAFLDLLGLETWAEAALQILPWLVVLGVWGGALSVLYRYGPSRRKAEWRWVAPGAAVATLLWVLGSLGFSYYVANFGSYDETYGSLGAVVVLLMWFYVSAYVAMLGAELNAEMEHQTVRDSTVDPDYPLGERNAFVADDVGSVP